MTLPARKHVSRELHLPPIDTERLPGNRLVQRAASIVLGGLVLLTALAVVVSMFVSVTQSVDAAGTLEPALLMPIRAAEPGLIRQVLVRTGDTVRAGQLLMRLDSLDLSTALDALRGQASEQRLAREQVVRTAPMDRAHTDEESALAVTHLERARATLVERMVENGFGHNVDSLLAAFVPGSHVVLDIAVADVRTAESEARSAGIDRQRLDLQDIALATQDAHLADLDRQMRSARARLERLEVRSPVRGIVLTEQIERLTGAQVQAGETLLEVGDPARWQAAVLVPEVDVQDIKIGDSTALDVPALRALNLPMIRGAVVSVAPSSLGSSTSGAVEATGPSAAPAATAGVYRVVLSVDAHQLASLGVDQLRRGYTVNGKIITKQGRIFQLVVAYVHKRLGPSRVSWGH